MKIRVFLDTNVFIYSFEFSESNSNKVISLLNKGEIQVVTSERVLKEVTAYFEKYHSIDLSRKFRRYIFETCTIVNKEELSEQIKELKGKIKEKDIEQLAVVKKYGIKYLISYDRDFDNIEEYKTPRRFLELIRVKVNETDF